LGKEMNGKSLAVVRFVVLPLAIAAVLVGVSLLTWTSDAHWEAGDDPLVCVWDPVDGGYYCVHV